MSTTIEYGYNYIFDLASRLSPEEQKQLLRELSDNSSSTSKERRESLLSEPDAAPYSPDEFYEFLLHGPVIDDEHIRLMLEAKEEVNRCGPILW